MHCDVIVCGNEKANGDSWYCLPHRALWIKYCISLEIHQRLIPESTVLEYKLEFDKKVLEE